MLKKYLLSCFLIFSLASSHFLDASSKQMDEQARFWFLQSAEKKEGPHFRYKVRQDKTSVILEVAEMSGFKFRSDTFDAALAKNNCGGQIECVPRKGSSSDLGGRKTHGVNVVVSAFPQNNRMVLRYTESRFRLGWFWFTDENSTATRTVVLPKNIKIDFRKKPVFRANANGSSGKFIFKKA